MAWLAARGLGRLLRLLFRVILVRGLFHALGFWPGIGILVVVAAVIWALVRRRGRRSPWS